MKEAKIQKRIELDNQRKEAQYLMNDIQEFIYIAEKIENNSRTYIIDLLNKEVKKQKEIADRLFKEIFS
jgi:hypothetical protein